MCNLESDSVESAVVCDTPNQFSKFAEESDCTDFNGGRILSRPQQGLAPQRHWRTEAPALLQVQ